jgi:hypothetical protein
MIEVARRLEKYGEKDPILGAKYAAMPRPMKKKSSE